MPKGLKIVNRANMTLCDSAQTIEVEYKDKDNEYNNQEKESNEENEDSDSDNNSSNKDSLFKRSRQPNSNSNSKNNLGNSYNNLGKTNTNKQVYILDGYILTTGVQSYISNEENSKDTLDNSSNEYKEADETLNTKDINRDAPSNKDQKSAKESANQ